MNPIRNSIKLFAAMAIFLIFCTNRVTAQFGIQGSYIAPSGLNIYVFKPAIGIDLKYTTGLIDSRVRYSFSIGYYKLEPTQDTFPYYEITSSPYQLHPGYDVLKNYTVIPVGIGIEYHPFEGRLAPYVGFDLNYFYIKFASQYYVPGYTDNNYNETNMALSIFPKIGLAYQVGTNWLIAGGAGFSLQILGTGGADNEEYLKSYLSLSYYLNGSSGNSNEKGTGTK